MKRKRRKSLAEQYPPSPPCACEICLAYCARPGWWTVAEAAAAIEAGHAHRMMLEMSPDRSFGVLSPAFRGNEVDFALQHFADRGCTFLEDGRCQLHGTGHQPLECRFCHHDRHCVTGARVLCDGGESPITGLGLTRFAGAGRARLLPRSADLSFSTR